jgi:hypothetical protein
MINNNEIARLKAALKDCTDGIRALRNQRAALDEKAAQIYRRGRADGLAIRAVKEIIRENAADPWAAYAAKLGITDADLAADSDNPLDKILGRA